MKTYSPKTRALAADVVLQAAVSEALAILREQRAYPIRYVLGAVESAVPLTWSPSTILTLPCDPRPAEAILLAAAQSAELLLDGA